MNTPDWEKEFDEEFRKYPNFTWELPVPTTRGESFPFFGEESELVSKVKDFIRALLLEQRREVDEKWKKKIGDALVAEVRNGRRNTWLTNGATNALSALLTVDT